MGLSIDQILNALEHTKTAEQTFEENLKDTPVETNTVASSDYSYSTDIPAQLYSQEEMDKVAELVQQGQVMARAFMSELTKIASGVEETETVDTNGAQEILNKLYQLNFQGE